MPDTSYDCDVVVIGAGAAGLAASKDLRARGLKAFCLEASDRKGGRCFTDTRTFGVPFDHGAHWLHNRPTNPFVEIGHAFGFSLYPIPPHYFTEGGPDGDAALDAVFERFGEKIETAVSTGQDVAADTLFDDHGEWAHTAGFMHALPMGRDPDHISTIDYAEGTISDNWLCHEGFGAILHRYHDTTDVTLNTPVRAVSVSRDGVQVRTDDGDINAQSVIVTASTGVLAADVIAFDPPLDMRHRQAIEGITMGTYNHTALLFEPGTIPVPDDCWVTYRIDEASRGSARGGGLLCNAGGTGLCVLETAGRFSRDLEKAGVDAASDVALDALARLFGNGVRTRVNGAYMTKWSANPFTRGSYSGALPGCAHLRPDLKRPHAERVFFAGEATSDANRATVAGAHHEGVRAAGEAATLLGHAE
ncbi:MAG: NAD(P)/FAD-dependent oxidoreductase [Pseudomonadota bacterium]